MQETVRQNRILEMELSALKEKYTELQRNMNAVLSNQLKIQEDVKKEV